MVATDSARLTVDGVAPATAEREAANAARIEELRAELLTLGAGPAPRTASGNGQRPKANGVTASGVYYTVLDATGFKLPAVIKCPAGSGVATLPAFDGPKHAAIIAALNAAYGSVTVQDGRITVK